MRLLRPPSLLILLHHTEQIPVRVLQDNIIRIRGISPRIFSCPKPYQAFHFFLLSVGIEIEVYPASMLFRFSLF